MEKLIAYIKQRITLTQADVTLLEKRFTSIQLPAKSILIREGVMTSDLFFVEEGVVRGFQNRDGKMVVEHLAAENTFITSLDSFMSRLPSKDTFETLTTCRLVKTSHAELELLKQSGDKWNRLIESILGESLQCKMQRLTDFQTLTAKERYLKFIEQHSHLALRVSIDNMASFLGMEPQSLSRIRREVII